MNQKINQYFDVYVRALMDIIKINNTTEMTEFIDAYVYFKNDLIHNEKGPAVIYKQSNKVEYWLNGRYYPNVNSHEELIIAEIII